LTPRQLRARGEFYRRKGRNAEALQAFDALRAQTPEDAWVIGRRAASSVAFKAAEQRTRTSHSLDRAALDRRYADEVSELRSALAASSGDSWVHCQLIDALRCAQRLGECLAECDSLIAQRPQFAWTYRRRAWAHRHRFDIRAALADMELSLTLQPDPGARAYRALLLGLLGKDVECQAEFAGIMAEDATLVEAFGLERALFWIMTEDYAQALPWLLRRYRRGDDYLRLYWRALATARMRGIAAAAPIIEAARCAAGRLASTEARLLGEYLLAALALLEGDERACAELERCSRLDPVLLELSVVDPSVRRTLANRFGDLFAQRFGGAQQVPPFFEVWVNR
jgi:hypothetical protein